MAKIVALGCGLIGQFVIERFIERGHEVIVIDLKIPPLLAKQEGIEAREGDVFELLDTVPGESIVVNMLPGRIGDKVRPHLLMKGHNVIDLAFTAEDPGIHQEIAEQNGAVLLWDVGIAPGMSNMLLRKAVNKMGTLDEVSIKVGGNPSKPDQNWSYMAPFSPSDVIEEYTRPARIKVDGVFKEVPALEELHSIQVEGYGEMEAFLTDGLRSVLTTIPASTMKEFTVRWPGHIEKWIQESPSMDEESLLQAWNFNPTREEFTWLEVVATAGEQSMRWVVEDSGKDGDGSMARTTGLVTAACALLFVENGPLKGCGLHPGIHPPEALSESAIDSIIQMMVENGVQFSTD